MALLIGCVALSGCVAPSTFEHPDFDVNLVLQALSDLDYLVTNYAWVLALLGVGG